MCIWMFKYVNMKFYSKWLQASKHTHASEMLVWGSLNLSPNVAQAPPHELSNHIRTLAVLIFEDKELVI